ncbi:MAG: hypothetical protein AMJ81_04570 [Phycisphaerae bacterium SM23_33]|nr:MAG: hypothetical protein AMJ81_04570 [Phycisphaerae bacterium SM23_33]
MAAARKSLADALRVSFRLLSLIMIVALGWLLSSGLATIQPEERAVRLTFGRIQGEAEERVRGEGLKLGWPKPFGDFARVSTREQTLRIDDLWLYEVGQDTETPISDRETREQGLRPGYDGALMTGDRGLVHVRIVCTFKAGVRQGNPDAEAVIQYLSNVRGFRPADREKPEEDITEELVRSAVCNAAIRAGAARTLDSVYLTARGRFAAEVKELAQQRLNELHSGIYIQDIRIPNATVPLTAIEAFNDVTNARSQWESRINEAKRDALDKLNKAAGAPSWPLLVGQLEARQSIRAAGAASPAGGNPAPGTEADEPNYAKNVQTFRDYAQAVRAGKRADVESLGRKIQGFGLMNLYATARERRDEELAAEILEEINRVLLSNRTGGESAKSINSARSYSAGVRQHARAQAERFTELAGKFAESPEVMLQRYLAQVKSEILTDPKVEKWYLPPGLKLVVRLSSDPDILRRIQRAVLQARKQPPEPTRSR